MPLWIHVLLLVSSVAAAGGQVLLKQGAAGRIEALAFVNLWVFGGLALYGLSTILWVVALARAPLTIVYPYSALTFVMVYAAGVLVFGEAVPWRALAGVGCVLAGLLLINLR